MSSETPFEARLADAYARYVADASVAVDAQMVAATVATRRSGRPLVWLTLLAPERRVGVLFAVGLVAILLAAAAGLVGSRLTEQSPTDRLIAYAMNGDIYLADQDGAHPRKVADGVPWTNEAGGGPSYQFGDGGPAWAPDGRHFLFFDIQGSAPQETGHIADASGRVVGSIPKIWVDATWSPDSTRIEAWTGGLAGLGADQRIGIFGIDGALQQILALPGGYERSRETPGAWAPDGRSVTVRLGRSGQPPFSFWQLPLDGSAPSRLPGGDPHYQGDVTVSPDRSRIAWIPGGNLFAASTLFVAQAGGTDPRAVEVVPAGASALVWSPTGRQVAYQVASAGVIAAIDVVDLATGKDTTVVAHLRGRGLRGWSPDGGRVLYTDRDLTGPSLWSVNADGTDRKVVVPGAQDAALQPNP